MTYREIIERAPAARRPEAEAYFKGLCDGYGISVKDAGSVNERQASSDEKSPGLQPAPVIDASAIDWNKI